MTTPLRSAYQFMREHAGYVVGKRAQGALHLARAEQLLGTAIDLEVASVEWVDDDEAYDPGDVCTGDEAAAKFESNEWTGPFGCVIRLEPDEPTQYTAAALWGIVVGPRGTADPYCRVVVAELASEIEDDLRQAIGDAQDAQHVGHFSRLGGTYWCDTCNSPYCELA